MQAPYGIWPALQYLSTAQQTPTPVRWYVDPSAGSDIGTFRGTLGAPLRTIQGLRDRLQSNWSQAAQLVSLRNATYPWTTLRPTLGGAPVVLFADDTWDPSVFNIILATTAGVGTNANSVAGAFVLDAHRGKSLRFTSGAAAGQYRTIQSNTVGALIPSNPFSPAPANGDAYQIFDSLALIAPSSSSWTRIADAGLANQGQPITFPDVEGYCFAGVKFATGASNRWHFDQGRYSLYGVEIVDTASSLDWRMTQAGIYAGQERIDGPTNGSFPARTPFSSLGTVSLTAWTGWGLTGQCLPHGVSSGHLQGYLTGDPTGLSYSGPSPMLIEWLGGSMRSLTGRLCTLDTGAVFRILNTGAAVVPELLGAVGQLLEVTGGVVDLQAGNIVNSGAGPVFRVTGSGTLSISQLVTGQAASGVSFQVQYGGKGYVYNGVPSFGRGGGATDYDCGNGTPVNKTFFAGAGVHMPQFTDGSTIIRTF